MQYELIMQSIGVLGVIIFYIIIAKLSARMGEGLMISPYYLLDYAACLIVLSTIPIHVYIHQQYELPHLQESSLDLQVLYFSLLLLGNVIVILTSIRYWWWLKSELWANDDNGGDRNE